MSTINTENCPTNVQLHITFICGKCKKANNHTVSIYDLVEPDYESYIGSPRITTMNAKIDCAFCLTKQNVGWSL